MFVFKKYTTGNFSDVFFILDNNERPDWMTDLKHTESAWF